MLAAAGGLCQTRPRVLRELNHLNHALSFTLSPPCTADCKYGEDNLLQLFNSCMFLAGALVALPAGVGARLFGRKVLQGRRVLGAHGRACDAYWLAVPVSWKLSCPRHATAPVYHAVAATPPPPRVPPQAMMLGAGCLFLTGAGLQAGAVNLGMLIAGRSIVGCGVGECDWCVHALARRVHVLLLEHCRSPSSPTLGSVQAPRHVLFQCTSRKSHRTRTADRWPTCFKLRPSAASWPPRCMPACVCHAACMTPSPLERSPLELSPECVPCLQLVNFGCQYIPVWGWRLSLSLCALPALILVLGGIVLPESPSHLIETGRWAEGKRVLVMLRGTDEVDAEYADICDAAQQAAKVSPLQVCVCVCVLGRAGHAVATACAWRMVSGSCSCLLAPIPVLGRAGETCLPGTTFP